MNTHDHKEQKKQQQSVANTVSQRKQPTNDTFQFVDNRPKAIIQQKIVSNTTQTEPSKTISKSTNDVAQLGGKKRKKPSSKSDSDDEYVPPHKKRKHRQTFSQRLRRRVIRKAPKNKSGLHVCPGCGKPLADKKGREIKTYYTSKSGKRHNQVSGQLDHYPPWAGRLKKLKKQRKSDAEIREDHDDPSRLRPLCAVCNQSHKFENTKKLPDSGFSDEEYFSDDDARDDEIWKKFRKDDNDDSGAGAGAGIAT